MFIMVILTRGQQEGEAAVARQLHEQHNNRPTLDVVDEYDVQNLLYALLKLHFDDIRPEECTPSNAGKSARMDFLLKEEQIVIEVKKSRKGLGAKEVEIPWVPEERRTLPAGDPER